MRNQLAWPRVIRDIGIVVTIATLLLVAIEVGILRGADLPDATASPVPAAAGTHRHAN